MIERIPYDIRKQICLNFSIKKKKKKLNLRKRRITFLYRTSMKLHIR